MTPCFSGNISARFDDLKFHSAHVFFRVLQNCVSGADACLTPPLMWPCALRTKPIMACGWLWLLFQLYISIT